MPIYDYRCTACGHTQEVLQKLSDSPLVVCPQCEQPNFQKQMSAPSFHLKGSGWYVTDFKNPQPSPTTDKPAPDKETTTETEKAAAPATTTADTKQPDSPASTPAVAASTPAKTDSACT